MKISSAVVVANIKLNIVRARVEDQREGRREEQRRRGRDEGLYNEGRSIAMSASHEQPAGGGSSDGSCTKMIQRHRFRGIGGSPVVAFAVTGTFWKRNV